MVTIMRLRNSIISFFLFSIALSFCGCREVVPDPSPQPSQLDREVEDKAGYTVKGLVWCGEEPVIGAVVSDGVHVTETNLEGKYWLRTDSNSDFVFVSIPSGYEAVLEGNVPQFYSRFDPKATEVQRFDFELQKVDQSAYSLVVMADIHICGRETLALGSDAARFTGLCVPDIQRYKASLPEGVRSYCLVLGDSVQDEYIAQSGFPEFFETMKGIDFPVFYVVGNHDHLPDAPLAKDEDARELKEYYMSHCGPTYYSFNIGREHYVVLDNCMMLGGGTNKYKNRFSQKQLDWLKKDLSKVADKSAKVIVSFHFPIFRNIQSSDVFDVVWTGENNAEFVNLFNDFSNVQLFCGHSHFAEIVRPGPRFTQTIHPSVCGCWWLSKLCHDGTPASYTAYRFDGDEMSRTLMAYDYPSKPQALIHSEGFTYNGKPAFQFNVPYYDSSWEVNVLENGVEKAKVSNPHSTDWYYQAYEYPIIQFPQYSTQQPRPTWHNLNYVPEDATARIQLNLTDPSGAKYSYESEYIEYIK